MTRKTPVKLLTFLRHGITPVGLACIGLGLLGCLAIYNATFHLEAPFQYVGRQFVWLVLAATLLVTVSATDRKRILRVFPWLAIVVYAMLWLVLRLGVSVNGMTGWFAWHGIFLQPSEVAKPLFVLCLASGLQMTAKHRGEFKHGYLPVLGILLAWILPIMLQPDFGTVLTYILTFAIVYACMGGRLLYLAGTAVVSLPAVLLIVGATPYLRDRFTSFLHPAAHAETSGWHILQFQRTLASGGAFGQSWGNALWARTYLPFGYSDSIFATIGESMGFVGLLPFVLILVAWVMYGYRRIQRTNSYLTAATITGMVVCLEVQAFIHLSVNLGMLPPTGITLPLISYGGSSLIATVTAVGIVEAFSRSSDEPPQENT